jgi:hypothetical protein
LGDQRDRRLSAPGARGDRLLLILAADPFLRDPGRYHPDLRHAPIPTFRSLSGEFGMNLLNAAVAARRLDAE